MMDYKEHLKSNIAAELGRHGVSQSKAAKHLQLSPASFGSRLQGRTDFRIGELLDLAKYLQVPFSTLTEGIDSPSHDTQVSI